MKRFFTVLAAVALAGAIYVATAPGSQTEGPTARQFNALKKQVAKLQKQENLVSNLALSEAGLLLSCMSQVHAVSQFGDPVNGTYGFTYQDPNINTGNPYKRSALDYTANDDPNAVFVTGGDSSCYTEIHGALHRVGRLAGAARR